MNAMTAAERKATSIPGSPSSKRSAALIAPASSTSRAAVRLRNSHRSPSPQAAPITGQERDQAWHRQEARVQAGKSRQVVDLLQPEVIDLRLERVQASGMGELGRPHRTRHREQQRFWDACGSHAELSLAFGLQDCPGERHTIQSLSGLRGERRVAGAVPPGSVASPPPSAVTRVLRPLLERNIVLPCSARRPAMARMVATVSAAATRNCAAGGGTPA
jgi:hypothetical protein